MDCPSPSTNLSSLPKSCPAVHLSCSPGVDTQKTFLQSFQHSPKRCDCHKTCNLVSWHDFDQFLAFSFTLRNNLSTGLLFTPGFPLTLALHTLPSLPTSMGYPVVHTTAKMGLFCSSGVSQSAVDTMCKNLGHRRGFKIPPSLLGQPENLPPQFVLQVILNNIFLSINSHLSSWWSARAMRKVSLTASSPPGAAEAARRTTS